MIKRRQKKGKLNNRGAALVSVLVITTFITILATTMLYMATVNYRQKLTDYQNKDSFYTAEKTLDELKSAMVKDVEEAYYEAYKETSSKFLFLGDADERQKDFQDAFTKKLEKIWKDRVPVYTDDGSGKNKNDALVAAVKSIMTGEYAHEAQYIYRVGDYGVYEIEDGGKKTKKFVLRGVQVEYTSGNYTTFIYTDICVEPPDMEYWSVDSSVGGGEAETAESRDIISFTDCISYTNWQRADYEYGEGYGENNYYNKLTEREYQEESSTAE